MVCLRPVSERVSEAALSPQPKYSVDLRSGSLSPGAFPAGHFHYSYGMCAFRELTRLTRGREQSGAQSWCRGVPYRAVPQREGVSSVSIGWKSGCVLVGFG